MTAAGPAAPAGWYNDPSTAGQLRYWDGTTWTAHTSPAAAAPPVTAPVVQMRPTFSFSYSGSHGVAQGPEAAAQTTVRRIADYERWTGWMWGVIGVIQIVSLIGILAGAWNIYAASTRIKNAPRIAARDSRIPAEVEPLGSYIVLGAVNLVLGGVIGVLFVGADLFVRDQILKNRHLFTGSQTQTTLAPLPTPQAR